MDGGKDYYKILGVQPSASFQDIAKAFRVLSITNHPLKNPEKMADANFKFCQICEAFEVLSDRKFFSTDYSLFEILPLSSVTKFAFFNFE